MGLTPFEDSHSQIAEVSSPIVTTRSNARLGGRFYRLEDRTHLPAGMRLGVAQLA